MGIGIKAGLPGEQVPQGEKKSKVRFMSVGFGWYDGLQIC